MKRKLLFVIPALNIGGTNSSLVSIIEELKKTEKYDIHVFAISHTGKFLFSDKDVLLKENIFLSALFGDYTESSLLVKILALFIKSLRRFELKFGRCYMQDYICRLAAKSLQKVFDYDYAIAFQEGAATVFTSYINGKPTLKRITWIHCDYSKHLEVIKKKEESLYSKYDYIVCVSKYTASVFKNIYPFLAHRTKAIYNLFDSNRIIRLSENKIDDSHFKTDYFTMISVGRIHAVKRFREIPAIARYLVDCGLQFKWYILGPNNDDSEYTSLSKNIEHYGVHDYVECLGNKTNPYSYYKAADLLVCTSSSEACPMIFNEAKILGVPVVSTDFPSAGEFVSEGVDGFIASIENIGEVLYKVISNKELYDRLCWNIDRNIVDNESIIKELDGLFMDSEK